MNWFKLFGLKQKSRLFCPVELFFDSDSYREHGRATEGKKDKKRAQKDDFLANRKSLNQFYKEGVGIVTKN